MGEEIQNIDIDMDDLKFLLNVVRLIQLHQWIENCILKALI
jgi:hypothetical protein